MIIFIRIWKRGRFIAFGAVTGALISAWLPIFPKSATALHDSANDGGSKLVVTSKFGVPHSAPVSDWKARKDVPGGVVRGVDGRIVFMLPVKSLHFLNINSIEYESVDSIRIQSAMKSLLSLSDSNAFKVENALLKARNESFSSGLVTQAKTQDGKLSLRFELVAQSLDGISKVLRPMLDDQRLSIFMEKLKSGEEFKWIFPAVNSNSAKSEIEIHIDDNESFSVFQNRASELRFRKDTPVPWFIKDLFSRAGVYLHHK